ncbi:PREDICTED: uncharacterized protein LOC106120231 [Papilio xuthus]|uniref:Uncharacterized protein LOC106120231 n=1 Tax=Papilio xuthus TaxID=66420 RepID=A0AAJ6ZEQ0_PAPXU|nr:PREDICTED: uncharacterized protein LOC106120231 [Papilio xuthus]
MASDPAIKRLCAVIALFVAIICIFGGYMLGRSGRGEARRGSDAALLNLTAAVDGLFRRARRISPKSVHHKDAGKVAARLAEALGGGAGAGECGARSGAALAELARACLHAELHKVTRAINNASLYLDSLR